MMNKLAIFVSLLLACATSGRTQSVVNTKHNLSVSGPGPIRATSESEVCIFCHTPHNSAPKAPLWNKADPGVTYTLYGSSTTDASPGQPSGASALCLSCHDGTVALGDVVSRGSRIGFASGVTTMPAGKSNLSTDLSDDHPISFVYNSSLAASDGELADPSSLSGPVKLENGFLQCTSCHDPHDDNLGDFLVASSRNSELCLYCHTKTFWSGSSHDVSSANWNGSGNDPWFHTPYTTVSTNACENCHNPHNSSGQARLTNYLAEEDNCLDCHNGNVAGKNIESELNKPYNHDVYSNTGVHDPSETNVVSTQHVECADCHNPHAVQNGGANPPAANGFIAGVKGVDSNGNNIAVIQNQFELCYRCHADSPDKPGSSITRQIEQSNVRLEFDLTNPSFHPVEGPGQNSNVPSLISPLNESSKVYCTDCHASDGSSTKGPHGSVYPRILKYQYETADHTTESYQAYRLCYQCHDRNSLFDKKVARSGEIHKEHVREEDVPCSACHDPHGISSSQGNSTNNSHLINFDVSIASPEPNSGRLEFEDQGTFKGRCYLQCHGEKHSPKSY